MISSDSRLAQLPPSPFLRLNALLEGVTPALPPIALSVGEPQGAVPDFVPAGAEINRAILETFRTQGIAIPFPQREVRLLGGA